VSSQALSRKAVVAVVVGNWLEFYDFLAFTFFAVMIGRAFFPGGSEFGSLLSALATFGVASSPGRSAPRSSAPTRTEPGGVPR